MRYFDISEFNCPCCGTNYMDHDYLERLDDARHISGVAFIVNSGYRCLKHNIKVKGSSTSSHPLGLASDIKCVNDAVRSRMIEAFHKVGITRIGVRKDFLHNDYDLTKNQHRIWVY